MKYLITIALFAVFSCHSMFGQDNIKEFDEINVEAKTRGSFFSVKVNQDKAIFQHNGETKTFPVSKVRRDKLIAVLNSLNLEEIKSLKVPSNERSSDKSMFASMQIKIRKQLYESPVFDLDRPPVALKELMTILYSFQNLE